MKTETNSVTILVLTISFLLLLTSVVSNGCVEDVDNNVENGQNLPPVANPGPDSIAQVLENITFHGGESRDPDGSIMNYTWDFGDGEEDYGVEVTHFYSKAGTYKVILWVTDDQGMSNKGQCNITITSRQNIAPVANAGKDIIQQVGQTVHIFGTASYDPDGFITIFSWDFGDGGTDSGMVVEYIYSKAGNYIVTLTVFDGDGAMDSDSINVTIIPPPLENLPPVANAGKDITVIKGEIVLFDGNEATDPDGTIVNYTWNTGDGGILYGVVAEHIYLLEGFYLVTLSVKDDDNATHSDSFNVTVTSEPTPNQGPDAEAGGDREIYEGETVHFDGGNSSDDDGAIVNYTWEFHNGEKQYGKTASYQYLIPGVHPVSLTVQDDDNETDIDNCNVTVHSLPPENIPPKANAGDDMIGIYAGVVVQFNGSNSSDPDGSILEYLWDFGDGENATGGVVEHIYVQEGSYLATLRVTDDMGAVDNDTINITVLKAVVENLPPVAIITVDNTEWDVSKTNVTLNASDSNDIDGYIVNYTWDFGDGGPNGYEPVLHHTYESYSDYKVVLTVTDNNGSTGEAQRWLNFSEMDKPAIYLYPDMPTSDTVSITLKGVATKTIPHIPLSHRIEWKGLWVNDGNIFYNGERFDYLFYEGVIYADLSSSQGWILERDEQGTISIDGKEMSYMGVMGFFRVELEKAGLYENEIRDFMDFWFGSDHKIFLGKESFRYAIMYIPPEMIDDILVLETEHHYDEILRVFFSIHSIEDEEITLSPPTYYHPPAGASILHEWGMAQKEIFISRDGPDFHEKADGDVVEGTGNDPENYLTGNEGNYGTGFTFTIILVAIAFFVIISVILLVGSKHRNY